MSSVILSLSPVSYTHLTYGGHQEMLYRADQLFERKGSQSREDTDDKR